MMVVILNVFWRDKVIPEECKPYIKECVCDITNNLENIIEKAKKGLASPEELTTLWDILDTINNNKASLANNKKLPDSIKFQVQNITNGGGGGRGTWWWGGWGWGWWGGWTWWGWGWGSSEPTIIYLTSTVYILTGSTGTNNWWWGGWGWGGWGWGWGGWGWGGWWWGSNYFRCVNPFGWTPISHWDEVFAYEKVSVEYPEKCKWETRICDNGTLNWTFSQKSCKVIGDSCSLNGVTIAHGDDINMYLSSTAPFPDGCEKKIETRRCIDGVLGWTATFKSCTELPPKWCSGPDWKVWWHWVIWAYYRTAQLVWAAADGEDVCYRKGLTCYNGTRTNAQGTHEWFGGHIQSTCTARINAIGN